MEFEIKIYGPSSQWRGYKWEVYDVENDALLQYDFESSLEHAEVAANRYVDEFNPQPLRIYRRSTPEAH